MAGPVDPRLLRRARATRVFLIAGVAVGSAIAVLVLCQAWVLSHTVVDVFERRTLERVPAAVGVLAVIIAGRAMLVWAHAWIAQRTSATVKSALRRDIMAARLARPHGTSSTATLVALITQGLDALDGYFAKYLPQLVLAVTVPVILGTAILTYDLTSAVVLAVTLPLIPVFMALVGWTTAARMRRRWRVQARLANHFADLIAGLATLQVFGRATAQREGLRRTEQAHRAETMGTLRVSFLSALVLELLSSLSVAVVAVFIGVRVVAGELDFATGLFVLMLAPEVYLPVRMVGVHYHDAADGVAAAEAAFAEIERVDDDDASPARPAPDLHNAVLRLNDLGYRYPEAEQPALHGLTLDVAPGSVVALTGASGAGKSTALSLVMGFTAPSTGSITADDVPLADIDPASWRRQLAWVGQSPGMLAGTVADNVALGHPSATHETLRAALDRAGGGALPLDQPVGDDGEGLSAGERRRVGIARALVRIEAGAALLVLDEPTAGLDSDTEAAVLRAVRDSGAGALVVSHRPAVLAEADRVIELRPALSSESTHS